MYQELRTRNLAHLSAPEISDLQHAVGNGWDAYKLQFASSKLILIGTLIVLGSLFLIGYLLVFISS